MYKIYIRKPVHRLGTAVLVLQHHLIVHRCHHIHGIDNVVQWRHCWCQQFGVKMRHFTINEFCNYRQLISTIAITILVHVDSAHWSHTSVHAGLELRVFKVELDRARAVRLIVGVVQTRKVRVTQCLLRGQSLSGIEGQQSLEQRVRGWWCVRVERGEGDFGLGTKCSYVILGLFVGDPPQVIFTRCTNHFDNAWNLMQIWSNDASVKDLG